MYAYIYVYTYIYIYIPGADPSSCVCCELVCVARRYGGAEDKYRYRYRYIYTHTHIYIYMYECIYGYR